MPEGHSVHRTANQFKTQFVGTEVSVFSPQGRFDAGAAKISGSKLVSSSACGKQLFLVFENNLAIRIHLGIYGKWNFYQVGFDDAPEIWGQVRARFGNENFSADLRGPTVCEVLTRPEMKAVLARLGPDPLNPDTGGRQSLRFIEKVSSSKTAIGALLMNQQVISGIGNVYRAEILFRAKLNPFLPGNQISESKLREIWDDSVLLMKVGVKRGVMITRDQYLTKKVSKADRNFVYKREGMDCLECGHSIQLQMFVARKLYFCPNCQNV
jgi:endonuclease-8